MKYVTVEKCSDCGHIYAIDPSAAQGVQSLPDPDAQLEQYAERNNRLIDYWRKTGFLTERGELLDFGAGSGHILRSIAEQMPSIQINCVEANVDASNFLKSLHFNVVDDLSQARIGGYDAILLIELLEHVINPIELLTNIKLYLRRNGKIFITTPIGETRSGNRNLQTYDTREHIQFWTENSFKVCCNKAGLTFSAVRPDIMYPRSNSLFNHVRDIARIGRDALLGTRHLVGFLE